MKLPLGLIVIGALAGDARADILSLRVEGHLGGGGGASVGQSAVAEEQVGFFDAERARGPAWGFLVGVEALFVDVWVDHHEYVASGELRGTWTQFMAGIDLDHELRKTATEEQKKRGEEGKQTGYVEVGLGFGFGVGTGQQPELPLDNAQVSDKGFVVEAKLGAGFVLGGVVGVGVSVPVSAGYLFKSGFANDRDNQYASVQGAVMVVVRGKIKLK